MKEVPQAGAYHPSSEGPGEADVIGLQVELCTSVCSVEKAAPDCGSHPRAQNVPIVGAAVHWLLAAWSVCGRCVCPCPCTL